MPKFEVVITSTVRTTFEIEAKDADSAENKLFDDGYGATYETKYEVLDRDVIEIREV